MFVNERFTLNPLTRRYLHSLTPDFGFGGLGAVVYYRTYSRLKEDGSQEQWADTVIRVIEGVMSIRKDWYLKHYIEWDETKWQKIANDMADAMFHFRFLPPGRGIWAMGTPYVYERGAMALQNCGYTEINLLSRDTSWAMDALMCGVGVGFGLGGFDAATITAPTQEFSREYRIPDTREGWVESVRLLIESFEKGGASSPIVFIYDDIRPEGEPIRGFGGTASGAGPLIKLHDRIREILSQAGQMSDYGMPFDSTRVAADIMNAIGACVVAGNVRRSAEIALGSPTDQSFLNLKNYGTDDEPGPAYDRRELGWMSNNSIVIRSLDDLNALPSIADRIRNNGEPGIFNLLNVQKYGRYKEKMYDPATGCNPCAEQPLEDKEVCCLVEVFPTKCETDEQFFEALRLAQIYAHTVTLLPTHRVETNAVIARNHRIGESLSGIADWFDTVGAKKIVDLMRNGYDVVRETNRALAKEAGVPESVRVTTVKPSGTVSQLAGVSPGMHYPPYTRYIRRVRVGANTPIVNVLKSAGVPWEVDVYSDNTIVFEFPVEAKARRSQRDISMWQKAAMVVMLQLHWADNMVSNTITFDPRTEGHQIEDLLAYLVPLTKSISLLPDTDEGAYAQMPYEGITVAEYQRRVKEIRPIDWSKFGGSDGERENYCTNDGCEV
jgi:ribonucleoside-diphosphate reductase alpha chain